MALRVYADNEVGISKVSPLAKSEALGGVTPVNNL